MGNDTLRPIRLTSYEGPALDDIGRYRRGEPPVLRINVNSNSFTYNFKDTVDTLFHETTHHHQAAVVGATKGH